MPDANDVILDPDDLEARASRVLSFALGNGVLFVLGVDPEGVVRAGRRGRPRVLLLGRTARSTCRTAWR